MANESGLTLGQRLLIARLMYGARLRPPREITKADVAQQVGLTPQAYGYWESDESEPRNAKLRAAARYLHVEETWLISDVGPMYGGALMLSDSPLHHPIGLTPDAPRRRRKAR